MFTPSTAPYQSEKPKFTHSGEVSPTKRIILAIATTGRKEILTKTISNIYLQSRLPNLLIVSIADQSDIDREILNDLPFPHEVMIGPKGACHQRNQVVRSVKSGDVLLFTDDDFLLQPDYLQEVEKLFAAHSDIVMATGTVSSDGISGPGYSHEQGIELLSEATARPKTEIIDTVYNGYGCNMAIRAAPIVENSLRFDENLPFYSWLEDVDFSRQIARFGRIVKSSQLSGVHLGTKTGRSSGRFLGYSQVANPLYLMRKGTMSPLRVFRLMGGNILANLAKSLWPEPWIDRRGRLAGNLEAFIDLLRGKLSPSRVLEF